MLVRMAFGMMILAAALPGCGPEPAPQEIVVVDIAGEEITLAEFDRFLLSSAHEEAAFLPGDVMAGLFEQFVEEELLLRAARDAGIDIDPAVVSKRVAALARTEPKGGSSAGAEKLRTSLERRLLIEELVSRRLLNDVSVTDDDVRKHFEANRRYYERSEVVDVSQILLEEEGLAEKVRETVTADPERFEELAREHSVGPDAENGGRLGTFGRGELPPSFENEVFSLKPGQISEVVKTDFGFHIFRLNAREASKPLELEEVEEAIRVELLRQKSDEAMESFVEELKKRYPVTVHREHLSFALVDWNEASGRTGGLEGIE